MDIKTDYSTGWMHACTLENFDKPCKELVDNLDIQRNGGKDTETLFKRHLNSACSGNWLHIVENAVDLKYFFRTRERLDNCIPSD